jgi:hypothetical protein
VQLAVEAVYLEATLQLVSKTSSSLSGSQAKALEDLAFDWVLNADKFVDSRFLDLLKAREKVRSASGPPNCNALDRLACLVDVLCVSEL